MSDDAINVKITADVGGVVAGMKQAAAATKGATDDIKKGLDKVKEGATAAGNPFEGLTDKLREFKGEATSNGRVARFLANELAEIVPGANAAGGAMKSLIAIGLGGASIFSGIELGVFALGKLNESMEETKKLAKEVSDAERDTGRAVQESLEAVERGLHPTTATQAAWGAEVRKTNAENRKLEDQISTLIPKVGGVGDTMKSAFAGAIEMTKDSGGMLGLISTGLSKLTTGADPLLPIRDTSSQIDQLWKQIAANVSGLNSKKPLKDHVAEEESTKKVKDARLQLATESEAREVERHAKLRELHAEDEGPIAQAEAKLQSEIETLRAEGNAARRANTLKNEQEANAEIKKLNDQALANYLRGLDVEMAALRQHTNRVVAELQTQQRAETGNERTATAQRKYEEQQKDYAALADLRDKDAALAAANNDKQLAAKLLSIQREADREAAVANELRAKDLLNEKEFQAELARIKKTADTETAAALGAKRKQELEEAAQAGEKLGAVLSSVAQGGKGAGAAVKEAALGMIESFEKMALQAAIAAAMEAGSATASVPFVGPALAIGAMGAVFGAANSILHSAEGGMDVGAAGGLMMFHPHEMMLPAPIANPLRESIKSGALSGKNAGDVHIHVGDAHAVERMVKNNRAAITRTAKNMRANGSFR